MIKLIVCLLYFVTGYLGAMWSYITCPECHTNNVIYDYMGVLLISPVVPILFIGNMVYAIMTITKDQKKES